jgi:hypothetical protein
MKAILGNSYTVCNHVNEASIDTISGHNLSFSID